MAKCGQACPYNTLDGCKVKEYNAICPLTNTVKPITEYQMTNADRIRAMSDEELAIMFAMLRADLSRLDAAVRPYSGMDVNDNYDWLQQLAE